MKPPLDFQTQLAQGDQWLSLNNNTGLKFLKLVFIRVRPGMADFIIRSSVPRSDSEKPVIASVRADKSFSNSEGYTKIAEKIIQTMLELGDSSVEWARVDAPHLGDMLSVEYKFFASRTNSDMLRFVTEALNEKQVKKDETV
jgi:hypothetical protein